MYYRLLGRMETTTDILEVTSNAFVEIVQSMKKAQRDAEDPFLEDEIYDSPLDEDEED
jgi:hypothetical protein